LFPRNYETPVIKIQSFPKKPKKHDGLCLTRFKNFSEAQNVLNDRRRVSFHKSPKQSTSLNERQSFC
jgi:hypothetical protein